jgi:hypothetical protein
LLRPGGRILVEVEPVGSRASGDGATAVRIECDGGVSRWFPWAWLTGDALPAVASDADLRVDERWTDGGREFCSLVAL